MTNRCATCRDLGIIKEKMKPEEFWLGWCSQLNAHGFNGQRWLTWIPWSAPGFQAFCILIMVESKIRGNYLILLVNGLRSDNMTFWVRLVPILTMLPPVLPAILVLFDALIAICRRRTRRVIDSGTDALIAGKEPPPLHRPVVNIMICLVFVSFFAECFICCALSDMMKWPNFVWSVILLKGLWTRACMDFMDGAWPSAINLLQ